MVKEPVPGQVKTRLGRDIGMVRSAWWFRHTALSTIRRLSSDTRWQTVLAVSPDKAGLSSRIWPEHLTRVPQGQGDLGARMRRAISICGPGPVILIGSDIPGISTAGIARAFRAAAAGKTVFGPAEDGGFWLVGLKGKVPRHLFRNVRWSSAFALSDSIAPLGRETVALADRMHDVDTASDLR